MAAKSLEDYFDAFYKMKRATMRGIKAPHKPLLLISIIELVKKGVIIDNKIFLTDTLVEEFKTQWQTLIGESETKNRRLSGGLIISAPNPYPFKCSIENPFFHLSGEPFWQLVKCDEKHVLLKNYSLKQLKRHFQYAEINQELFNLISSEEHSYIISELLKSLL